MPWPSSTLPVSTIMLPSASMRIHESKREAVLRSAGRFARVRAAIREIGSSEKPTTSAFPAARMPRRETPRLTFKFIGSRPGLRPPCRVSSTARRAAHSPENSHVAPAAA